MLSAETDSQHGDCGTGTERPCGARAHPGNAEQKEDSIDGCRTGTGEKYDGPAARGGDPCIWKTLGRRAEQLS